MGVQLPDLAHECFFISPIGADGSEVRSRSDGVMEYIVADAAKQLDLEVVRGDQIAQPGQITHQIIEHVLGAKAAVADLTGRNPNVYYELAVRHTARLPVALIVEDGEDLPFDIAQMRTIHFRHNDLASAARCRSAIVEHLNSALTGAVDSPITTSLDLQSLRSGNVIERTVGDIANRVEELISLSSEIRSQVTNPSRRGSTLRAATPEFIELFQKLHRTNQLSPAEVAQLINEGVGLGYWSRKSRVPPSKAAIERVIEVDPDEAPLPDDSSKPFDPGRDIDPDDIPF